MRRRHGLTQAQVIFIVLALAGTTLVLAPTIASWIARRGRKSHDIAAEAKDYLIQRQVKPLKADLDALLAKGTTESVPALPHPLLDEQAPDFQLADHNGRIHRLPDHLANGPVVLVFYYGYYCNHCVAQLFALQDDLAKFRELGAEILAVSPDLPEETAEKFGKYGKFTFPVLSDAGNKTAAAYSVFQEKSAAKPQMQLHGTFVIDKEGIVRWCHYDSAPFTNNEALLVEVARVVGRLRD
jgi:thioredoxin-dependent peroxiredoxin